MNATELLEEKYPTTIIDDVRERIGSGDNSNDQEILEMSKNEIFKHVVNWNGLLGNYDSTIKYWILDIYGIDLDEIE